MKKIISVLILFGVLYLNSTAVLAEKLPELPNLPVEAEFDTVIPPDDLDVFAPSETPSPTVSKPVSSAVTKPTASTAQPKPSQSSSTIKVTPVNNSNQTTTQSTINKPPQQVIQPKQTQQPTASKPAQSGLQSYKVVKKGKKFKVALAQTVSSNTPSGTRVSFKSLYPESCTYVTIPAGTTFYGIITNTHAPQYTGNGGLIEINVKQMVYQGKTYPIDAKISVANKKKIFLNNIKGQRMYLRSFPKAMKFGTKYFGKMWRLTAKLAKNESGVEIILTPFSFTAGTVVYLVNAVVSPVIAVFYKGKSITIPANSQFTIQLRQDASL